MNRAFNCFSKTKISFIQEFFVYNIFNDFIDLRNLKLFKKAYLLCWIGRIIGHKYYLHWNLIHENWCKWILNKQTLFVILYNITFTATSSHIKEINRLVLSMSANKLHQVIWLNTCINNYNVKEVVKHAYASSCEYKTANSLAF